jgi:hypothetical protein
MSSGISSSDLTHDDLEDVIGELLERSDSDLLCNLFAIREFAFFDVRFFAISDIVRWRTGFLMYEKMPEMCFRIFATSSSFSVASFKVITTVVMASSIQKYSSIEISILRWVILKLFGISNR